MSWTWLLDGTVAGRLDRLSAVPQTEDKPVHSSYTDAFRGAGHIGRITRPARRPRTGTDRWMTRIARVVNPTDCDIVPTDFADPEFELDLSVPVFWLRQD